MTCHLHLDTELDKRTLAHKHISKFKEKSAHNNRVTNGMNQGTNMIQHKSTSSYYITSSAVMNKQYNNFQHSIHI